MGNLKGKKGGKERRRIWKGRDKDALPLKHFHLGPVLLILMDLGPHNLPQRI